MNDSQLPIPRSTLTQMVAEWNVAAEEIRTAFGLLVAAEARLKSVFKPDSYLFDLSRQDRKYRDYNHPDELLADLKRDVWSALVDKMGIKSAMSLARAKELEDQLAGKTSHWCGLKSEPEPLPEITEANIL